MGPLAAVRHLPVRAPSKSGSIVGRSNDPGVHTDRVMYRGLDAFVLREDGNGLTYTPSARSSRVIPSHLQVASGGI